eukprot:5878729-Prymnesium_polylepis.1
MNVTSEIGVSADTLHSTPHSTSDRPMPGAAPPSALHVLRASIKALHTRASCPRATLSLPPPRSRRSRGQTASQISRGHDRALTTRTRGAG